MRQLRVSLRCNNQLTVGLQNCPTARAIVYQSLDCLKAGYSKEEKLRFFHLQQNIVSKRSPKYDYFGNEIVKTSPPKRKVVIASPPKLDLIRKFQRQLKWARSAALGFLVTYRMFDCLVWFGQFRLNSPRNFGSVAGQRIREAGAAMEIAAQREMRFCHCTTLTLPANTRESFEVLAAYSSELINRLFQPIRRYYKDLTAYFYVWEFQKRGALHLHIAHYHPDECEGMLIGNILIEQWHKLLIEISENSGVYMLGGDNSYDYEMKNWYQYHTQPMYKSVAGYFAKYAGKSSKAPENDYVREHSKTLSPKRFWGSSFYLKKIIKENSFSLLIEFPNEIEAGNAYQSVISAILEKTIVMFNRYEFEKYIEKVERFGFKGKAVFNRIRTKVAEGFRDVFYTSPEDYQDLLKSLSVPNPSF